MTAPVRDPRTLDPARKDLVRVSVRELHETAARALVARGVSWGEAQAAGEVVVTAELHEGVGLAALCDELGSSGSSGASGMVVTGGPGPDLAVTDPTGRGPLLVATGVVELCLSTPSTVLFTPTRSCARIWVWAAVAAVDRLGGALALAKDDADGERHVAVVAEDGALHRWPTPTDAPHGVLLRTDPDLEQDTRPLSTRAARRTRLGAARCHGVEVDLAAWQEVRRAAHEFLVPEHRS